MTTQTSPPERVSTGVAGLDDILMGGFLREGFYLLQGNPGSGKTTLALRYAIRQVTAGERCLYVSLTETRRDLDSVCRSHGWSLDGVELCDLSRSAATLAGEAELSVFHPSEIELGETTQAVMEAVDRHQPHHVVFDGLAEMRLLAGDALRYRRQLLSLKGYFADRKVTVLLLDDQTGQFGEIQPESIVGGNIVLERHLPLYGGARRRLFVTKVRGANFLDGYHDYDIVSGGLVVHPRLVAAEHHDRFSPEIRSSGIEGLDVMLGGGISAGTTTLLLGPAGVGKSTIAMQFVVHGLREGVKAAVYAFDEVLGTMMERTEKLVVGEGESLRSFVARGLLRVQQVDPAELSAGAFAHQVLGAVDDGARIVVIDSLNGYLNAMPGESFLTTHLHELFSYLNQCGVTTICVVAQHGLLMGDSLGQTIDVSYLADTVLLFRYFESDAQILQAISVFKKRTGAHERVLRQLTISSEGVTVGEPLRGFRGIMTGVPRYEGSTPLLGPADDDG